MTQENKKHWEHIFETKQELEVSWYQKVPQTSIDLLLSNNISKQANIIDVGCGDSYFIDYLVANGYQNIYALDISEKALEHLKKRLGKNVENVHWIVSDILNFQPDVQFDFWHDRASFHFQTDPKDVEKYISIATNAIAPNGILAVGTFSKTGPTRCSGLNVSQYDEETMNKLFESRFKEIQYFTEDHNTPFGTIQNFIFCSFRKLGNASF